MSLVDQYAKIAGADKVYNGALFTEVLPFYKAWGALLPQIQNEAYNYINPFVQRELSQNIRGLNQNLARSGGYRFGMGEQARGYLQGNAIQSRNSQMTDFINARQQGFKSLFYDPAQEAWNQAILFGQQPKTPDVKTWQQSFNKVYA